MDIIDKSGFTKLFNLEVPCLDHFDYYIDQMSKTYKYRNIKNLLLSYIRCGDPNLNQHKVTKSHEISDFVRTTNAYIELYYDSGLKDLQISNTISYEEGKKYLSISTKDSNWASLKKYDYMNELGDIHEFFSKFQIPQVFQDSDHLRQFIFSNIDPKKISKVQRNEIQHIIDQYSNVFKFEFARTDESIFSFDSFESLSLIERLRDSFNIKIFSIQRVEDFRIDNIYDFKGNVIGKDLSNLDKNQFYLKTKQFITMEQINICDLYFRSNGKLATWVI